MANLALQARQVSAAYLPVLSPDKWPTADALMRAAREQTGLDEFGARDFREGIDQLLGSLREESQIEGDARTNILTLMLRRLENRLRVEDWHARNPQACNAQIAGPVAITGLPRTGTTALGNLMSLDKQLRPLRSWEQANPSPPPILATEKDDPRRLAMMEGIEAMLEADPEQMAMHLYDVDATEEDHDVLGLAFAAQHNTLPVPAYRRWWRGADMHSAYAYHRRVLQMLQASRPPNFWMLKAPHYKFHMEAIAQVYPDVRFVFTHRDPAKALSSYFSFVMNYYLPGSVERVGKGKIAQDIYAHLLEGMRIAVSARDRLGEAYFADVSQKQLQSDTMGTLQRLYGDIGLPFSNSLKRDVQRWHAENQAGTHGSHRYSPEDFGFTAAQIASDFSFYTQRFGHLC